jgi:sugar phosphate isomerase/epimerase
MISRRKFSASLAGLAAVSAFPASRPKLRIGATDWNLNLTCKLEAIGLAKKLGFDGIQVSIGRAIADEKMPLDNAELIAQFREESKKQQIPIDGTCLDRLHTDCLKGGNRDAAKRVSDGIRITKALGVRVMLMPFFGKCATAPEDFDSTAALLRELAPEAKKAGVILGLENTLSAEDNVRIMDQVKSDMVKVYYDVGNSAHGKHDVLKEIPWLGKNRICQFHFKDGQNYLGEGIIDFKAVVREIKELGFEGYANLETNAPSHQLEPDMLRNLHFIRGLMAA